MRDYQKLAARDVEINRLKVENWQLKGELGYPVPGHIPPGPFKCGLCEARATEVERLRAALKPFAMQDIDGMISFDELTLDREDFIRAREAVK